MRQRVLLTLLMFFISISLANAFQVPDTGITECYDADGKQINPCPGPGYPFYGQDGNLLYNGMSFIDHANGTLTDNVTGILWQKAADNNTRTWDDAAAYCNSLNSTNLGDHNTGWRLPTLFELHSIIDLSITSGAVVNPIFTGTEAAAYWTTDEDPDNSANAWILNFGTAEDDTIAKTDSKYVRCVWTEVAP